MSLISSRIALIHRCTILRRSGAKNTWGHDKQADGDYETVASDVVCRGWVYSARQAIEDAAGASAGVGRSSTLIEDRRLILAPGVDIRKSDRIGDVMYRGTTIIDGPMSVEAIVRRSDQIELSLKSVT